MSEKKVWVVGHKNPDTDSICAAIAYANLKNELSKDGTVYEPKKAGQLNEETKYVLQRFKAEEPELISDAGTQVKDIEIRKTNGVDSHISLKKAWELMKTLNVVTLPITKPDNRLEGVIVTGDVATSYMDVLDSHVLATARTQYKNIIETVNGYMETGNEHGYFVKGKVVIPTGTVDDMADVIEEDDLVIIGDRKDSFSIALEKNCSCMVVCNGTRVPDAIIEKAKKKEIVIISTPYDTFTVARLVNQSIPIKYFMQKDDITYFELDDTLNEVRNTMAKVRHRDFPVLDENGSYVGMISRRNLLDSTKKRLILVDHNEKTQAVNSVDEAEILEIIDHHRLGSLETISPVFFRNQPLGSTATIVSLMYEENGVTIKKNIAGLLLSAIVSDTLMFRSPTCTAVDKERAEVLAKIAGVEIEALAKEMFEAGSDFKNKSTEEIFYQDFKVFTSGDTSFGVAQISAMSRDQLNSIKKDLIAYMPEVMTKKKVKMVYVMLTDILDETTDLICGGKDSDLVAKEAFHVEKENEGYILKGVVSRKKQFVPSFMNALQKVQES